MDKIKGILLDLMSALNKFMLFLAWTIVIIYITWNLIKLIKKYVLNKVLSSKEKAVIVTGCDTGFGYATAKHLNSLGLTVFAFCLHPSQSDLKITCKFSDKMIVFGVDVTRDEDVQQAKQQIIEFLKENKLILWSVINNAGVMGLIGELEWGSFDSIKQAFDVNVFGLVRVARAFLPLIRQSQGRYVIVSSLAGRVVAPGLSYYSMSKHAASSFTDSLRREMDRWNVKVIAIEPFFYKTFMTQDYPNLFDKTWQETDEQVKNDYGNEYFSKLKSLDKRMRFFQRKNIKEVVNAITKGVITKSPEYQYQCASEITKFSLLFFNLAPLQFIDFTWKILTLN